MAEEFIVDDAALLPKMIGRPPEIDGVPKDDCRRHEIEPRRPVPLIFKCPIPQFAKPVEEYSAGQGIARLALVEIGVGAATQVNVIKPVEHKQRSLDPTDFPERP